MSESENGEDGENGENGENGEDNEEMGKLLTALKSAAKEEDLALGRMPPEAYQPLPAERRAAIADRLLLGAPSDVVPSIASMDRRRPRSGRRIMAFVIGPLVAAAAALVLVVRTFSGDGMAPLPDYGVSARGGIKEMRGGVPDSPSPARIAAPLQRLRAESRLVVVARPASAVEGPVAIRAFAVQATRADEVWPQVQVTASGEVEIRAPVAEVFGARTGHWDLVVLIGRAKALREAGLADALASQSSPASPNWRRLIVPLELEAP